MKINIKLIGNVFGIAMFAIASAAYAAGTDILHLTLHDTMTNSGLETNAVGTVNLTQNVQGKTDKQLLSLQLAGLTASNNYILFAGILDTNVTTVANFSTDGNGTASFQFGQPGKGKDSNNIPIPDVLNPLRNVWTLAIGTITTNLLSFTTNVVLGADFAASTNFQILVKRTIVTNSIPGVTNGVPASISLKANPLMARFVMSASHLEPSTSYIFAVNDTFETNVSSTASGRVTISANPDPTQVLGVHSVALWDSASNVVLRTTLP